MSILKRQGLLASWCDREIGAGSEWRSQIDDNLNNSALILLLVSPDFIASDYCYDIEMQWAMALHKSGRARIIPIILRPVDWSGAPFSKLQGLPRDARPVTKWENRDEAFTNIVREIRRIIEADIRTQPANPIPSPSHFVSSLQSVVLGITPLFVDRQQELAMAATRLEISRLVTLIGPPGVGKTELAKKLVMMLADKASVGEGVIYVDLQGVSLPGSVVSVIGNSLGMDRITDVRSATEVVAAPPVQLGRAPLECPGDAFYPCLWE